MRPNHHSFVPIGVAAGICFGAVAGPPTDFDLLAEFTSTSNPSGVWSFRHDLRLLPHVDAWQSALGGWSEPQPGWAESENGDNRLPFIFRSNGSETFAHDWAEGEIVGHSTDPGNGVGNGLMTIAFTAPYSGLASVSGTTWLGRDIGRSNDWLIVVGGVVLASGTTSSGDPYSSANPFNFVDGEVEPGALDAVELCAGEDLLLVFERSAGFGAGEFSVFTLSVSYLQIFPECPADLTGDCMVDGADLGALLAGWGGAGAGDLDGSGTIDGADLGLLLSQWGACPQG